MAHKLGPQSHYSSNTLQMSVPGFKDIAKVENGRNLFWTTDVNVELPIKMQSTGTASTIKPDTIPNLMRKTVKNMGSRPAMLIMRGKKEVMWTWDQYWNDSLAFAKALKKLGVEERRAVNIMGFNSPEWAICYYGSIFHNNVVSGVYITNGPKACHYQADNSEAQVICVDTLEQLNLYMGIVDQLPLVKAVVAWGIDKIPD